MRHLLKLCTIVTAIAFAAVAPGAASAQTKEGTYKGTYAANGTFKATAIGKDRVLLVADEYGMGVTDGFLDHFTWHCWGLEITLTVWGKTTAFVWELAPMETRLCPTLQTRCTRSAQRT